MLISILDDYVLLLSY